MTSQNKLSMLIAWNQASKLQILQRGDSYLKVVMEFVTKEGKRIRELFILDSGSGPSYISWRLYTEIISTKLEYKDVSSIGGRRNVESNRYKTKITVPTSPVIVLDEFKFLTDRGQTHNILGRNFLGLFYHAYDPCIMHLYLDYCNNSKVKMPKYGACKVNLLHEEDDGLIEAHKEPVGVICWYNDSYEPLYFDKDFRVLHTDSAVIDEVGFMPKSFNTAIDTELCNYLADASIHVAVRTESGNYAKMKGATHYIHVPDNVF